VYAVGALLLVAAAVVTLTVRQPDRVYLIGRRGRPTLESLLLGVRFIRSSPIILGAISLDLFAVLFGGAITIGLALVWGRFFPALAHVDRLEDIRPDA
jgi:hypothetical protein